MTRVSVVIPIYERADLLRPCLAALERTGLDGVELVLVDNASAEPAMARLLDAWETRAVVRRNPLNSGFAAGCNLGARLASSPAVVFLNSDTEVTPGWLGPLLDAVADPSVGMAGSRLLYPDGRVQHAGMALTPGCQPVHIHRGIPGDHPIVMRDRDLLMVTAACCAIRRDLFLGMGGFDAAYRNGHEDVDLCLRLVGAGMRVVYRAASVVVHHESKSPGRLDADGDNGLRFRDRWIAHPPDWDERLAEDGLTDVGSADCRWEGPLLDGSPEAALGRAAVRDLVRAGRRPLASEPIPGPLAPDAADDLDADLLAAMNRLRVGSPAADRFVHLTGDAAPPPRIGAGALIAVTGPGPARPGAVADAKADAVLAAGTPALDDAMRAVRPGLVAALDPAAPGADAARRAVLGVPRTRPGIGWFGPLSGRSGYAAAGRGMLHAAERAGLPVRAWIADAPPPGLEPPPLPVGPQDFGPGVVVAHNPPVLPAGQRPWRDVAVMLGMPLVGATCFETERLPASWIAECRAVEEVWVPSAFNRRTFADAGVDPEAIHVVPYPVDTAVLRPRSGGRDAGAPVTFLSIFEWTWRKGWDALLRAWAEEFAHDEPVRLVVVTYRGAGAAGAGSVLDQAVAHLAALGHDPGRIADLELVLEPVAHAEMPALYRSADAFVLPTRGEGAGMPILEAAACGVPVIATAWGGHEELMTGETAYPVAVERMVEAPAELLVDNSLYEGLLLADPSVASLRAAMRAVVDDPVAAAARGLRGRALVEERFSLAATAAALDARASALLGRARTGASR